MDLLNTFLKSWQDKKFIADGQTVLLAVSGGVDSMVMANLFLKSNILFAIAHCNFQLRGEDADSDEQFVTDWAVKHNIPFHAIRFDTKERSFEWKKSIQETARILRYDWLENIRAKDNYKKIATAHHANDNVETLLMNLFKGTGISGLHAIPVQNGNIIRPLLFAERKDIMMFAADNDITYQEDASNKSDKYLRNAVRLNILPSIISHFPQVIHSVTESIERFADAEIIYKKAIEQERRKLIELRGRDYYIPILKLKNRQPLNTICYELFTPFGFTPAQIPQIIHLLEAESGHFIAAGEYKIIRNRNFLIITAIIPANTDFIAIETLPEIIQANDGQISFSAGKVPGNIGTDANTAYVDFDKISLPLTMRRWRAGDYFYPIGMGMKKKKLSKYFKDEKIPLHEKEQVWIIESNKRIVWITGMRLDERFKITPNTKQTLIIKKK